MTDAKESVMKTINRGRFDMYIPLKFETKYDYVKLCSEIQKCIDSDIKKYTDTFNESLQKTFEEITDKTSAKIPEEISLIQKNKMHVDREKTPQRADTSRENDGTIIELSNTERGLMVEIHSGEMNVFYDKQKKIAEEFELYTELYGSNYTGSHNRFVLLPLRAQLNNDRFVWLNVILFVFENKMGILKLELPLLDISSQIFMENDVDNLIKGIEDRFDVLNVGQPLSLKEIYSAYIRRIVSISKTKIIVMNGSFKNIICTDFDGMPQQIEDINDDVKKDLFRISAAPFQVIEGVSYEKIAHEYIENQSWGERGFKYIASTTGDCLSIVDKSTTDWAKENYKKQFNIKEFDKEKTTDFHLYMAENICINVEFVITVLLLKKLNNTYTYGMKINKPKDIHIVERQYNLNLMFIADLQVGCYGTVSDQVSAFENMMPHYLKEKVSAQKMEAIDRILLDEENLRFGLIQNFLAFGSIAFTALFGLPAIHDTVSLIRKLSIFTKKDIPIVSIQNLSITVWVIFIIFLCVYTMNVIKNNSQKYLKL